MKIAYFFKGAILPVVWVLLITQPCYYLCRHFYNVGGFWHWMLLTVILEIVLLAIIYYIGMTKNERVFILNNVQKFLRKKK